MPVFTHTLLLNALQDNGPDGGGPDAGSGRARPQPAREMEPGDKERGRRCFVRLFPLLFYVAVLSLSSLLLLPGHVRWC